MKLQALSGGIQEALSQQQLTAIIDAVNEYRTEYKFMPALNRVMQLYGYTGDKAVIRQVTQEFNRRSAAAKAAKAEREYSEEPGYGGKYETWQAAKSARREFDHAVAASPRVDAVDASDYISNAAGEFNVPYDAVARIFYA